MDVIVVGAGGHGMVVCDVLIASGASVVAFVDSDAAKQGTRIFDIPVLATVEDLGREGRPALAMGIGHNAARRAQYERLRGLGFEIVRAIHPSAVVSGRARIAAGAVLMPNVVVNVGADVGENVILNTGCSIDHHCVIAAHSHVAPGATLAGDVHVGEETFVGAGAVIIPGVCVGSRCRLGAGAVVLDDVPDDATFVGIPARSLQRRVGGPAVS